MLVAREGKVVEQNGDQIWTPRRKLSLTCEFRANRQEFFLPPPKRSTCIFLSRIWLKVGLVDKLSVLSLVVVLVFLCNVSFLR